MRAAFVLIFCLFIFGTAFQLSQNGDNTTDKRVTQLTTERSNGTQLASCKTAKNISGTCVQRERCEFGPGGIDFTLYVTHSYKRPCNISEVCCPFQYLVVQTQPQNNVDDYNFDDDD